ncbi:MAG: hypothetical protein MJZ20_13790 [Bacteroidaceae bacterium]|nr:hypothetical protein [Bacteroidaceae bacterium]
MEGLNKFKEAFSAYADNYVIIGGTACEIVMSGTDMQARATHDIDMIVIVEAMSREFGECFWNFIREGGYQPRKRKPNENESARYELYRFVEGKADYPAMIELLSRHEDIFAGIGGEIEPLPIDEEVSSLSAIIMNDDYYHYTLKHRINTDGISHADPAALIALKTRAYLNLLADKAAGKTVKEKDIKKHRSDVLKLVATLPADENIMAPQAIVSCIHDFVDVLRQDWASLGSQLAQALDNSETFVSALLEQLDNLFIEEA